MPPQSDHDSQAAYTLGSRVLREYLGGAVAEQLNGLVVMGFVSVDVALQAVGQTVADVADAAGLHGGAFLAEQAGGFAKGSDDLQDAPSDGAKDFGAAVADHRDRGMDRFMQSLVGQILAMQIAQQTGEPFLAVDNYARLLDMNEHVHGDERSFDFWMGKNQANPADGGHGSDAAAAPRGRP